jgi:hypothetical protein
MHRSSGTETNEESAALETADSGNLPETSEATRAPTQRPGVRPPRRHRITSGDWFKNSIDRLVHAFISSNTETELPASSPIHLALEKFADDLGLDKLVAGFSVLESDSKARCFLAITNDDHARAWINRQIASKMVPDS